MGLFDKFKNKKKDLPLIARVNLVELKKLREEEFEKSLDTREVSLLASADFTIKFPKIRLFYVEMEKFYAQDNTTKIGTTLDISKTLLLPNNMTMEEACKVVSYISEKVERENMLEPACFKSVSLTAKELEKFGFDVMESHKGAGHYHYVSENMLFQKIRFSNSKEGVTDLFTVGGQFKTFKKSDMHERYFEWFTSGVTTQEIIDIYRRIGYGYLLEDALKPNDAGMEIPEGWTAVKVGDDVSACCHTLGKIVIEDDKTK